LVNRVRPALLVIPGMLILTCAVYSFTTLELNTGIHAITVTLVMLGIGMGLGTMPAITTGLNAVPRQLTGQASSLLNMLRQVASAVGVAILASILESRQDIQYSRLAEGISIDSPGAGFLNNQLTAMWQTTGMGSFDAHVAALQTLYLQVSRLAGALAFQDTFAVATLFALLSILPAAGFLLWKGVPREQTRHFTH
ncbi:MAG: hypothetical protein ACPLUI_13190, partial [Desulfofundulus sp.]